jgi:CRP/FNR family transcriptional regulator
MENTTLFTEVMQLKMNPLFGKLEKSELMDLAENLRNTTLSKGDIIDFYTEPDAYVSVILCGTVKLCELDDNGKEYIKDFYQENDLFGLPSELQKNKFEYLEVISNRLLIAKIPVDKFRSLMASNAEFSLRVNDYVWSLYRKMEKRYRYLANLKSVKSRLMYFIKDWAVEKGKKDGNRILLKNYLTHKDISDLICCTRVTVTHTINELKNDGFIDYSRGLIQINDINLFPRLSA